MQVLVHKDTEAQKLRERTVSDSDHATLDKKHLIFDAGHFATLRNFCPSLSNCLSLERELPEFQEFDNNFFKKFQLQGAPHRESGQSLCVRDRRD